jgi:hypothetical protein
MREDLAVGMKKEPSLFLFKDCRSALRFDYLGAAIHQGRRGGLVRYFHMSFRRKRRAAGFGKGIRQKAAQNRELTILDAGAKLSASSSSPTALYGRLEKRMRGIPVMPLVAPLSEARDNWNLDLGGVLDR